MTVLRLSLLISVLLLLPQPLLAANKKCQIIVDEIKFKELLCQGKFIKQEMVQDLKQFEDTQIQLELYRKEHDQLHNRLSALAKGEINEKHPGQGKELIDRLKTVFTKILSYEELVGREEIIMSITKVAYEKKVAILTLPQNQESFQWIGWLGGDLNNPKYAVLKGLDIKPKSANQGAARGLIVQDQTLSKIGDKPDKVSFYQDIVKKLLAKSNEYKSVPLEKNGNTALIKINKNVENEGDSGAQNGTKVTTWVLSSELKTLPQHDDEVVHVIGDKNEYKVVRVLADKEGNYITADLDLLAISSVKNAAKNGPSENITNDPHWGIASTFDLEIIREINEQFTRVDSVRTNPKLKDLKRDIVKHGPANRFSEAQEIEYPVTAYLPDGEVLSVSKGPPHSPHKYLQILIQFLEDNGYMIDRNSKNKKWGL